MFLTVNQTVIILHDGDDLVRQVRHADVVEATSLASQEQIKLEFLHEPDLILDFATMKVVNSFSYDVSLTASSHWGDLTQRPAQTFDDWKSYISTFVEQYTIQSDGSGVSTEQLRDQDFVNEFQGHLSLLTGVYFDGSSTNLDIQEANQDVWLDVPLELHANGTFDHRPLGMRELQPAGCLVGDDTLSNDVNGNAIKAKVFLLEGLTQNSVGMFRATMSFDPDEDGGQLEGRILFSRHSLATPNTDFDIATAILEVTQGADTIYPVEPLITFFIGDTIDTQGVGDAGRFRFQIKSTVPGDLEVKAFSFYINK